MENVWRRICQGRLRLTSIPESQNSATTDTPLNVQRKMRWITAFAAFSLSSAFAADPGVPKRVVDLGFAGEYLYQVLPGSVPVSKLDQLPRITPKVGMSFPLELRSKNFVGHVAGVVVLRDNGSVKEIHVISGNSSLLEDPARAYVAGWQFDTPRQNGKAVPTSFDFEFFVTDDWTYGPFVVGEARRPNPARGNAGRGSFF